MTVGCRTSGANRCLRFAPASTPAGSEHGPNFILTRYGALKVIAFACRRAALWGGVWLALAVPPGVAEPQNGPERRWAFAPVAAAEPPPDPDGWSANPVDRFL